jgi:hypothetical protein
MIASTVYKLIFLLLVISAASQERVNVTILQSNGGECPPADQLDAVISSHTVRTRMFIRNNILASGSFQNSATSCVNLPQGSPSGNYWIQNPSTGVAALQYCDNCSCGAEGWMGWLILT